VDLDIISAWEKYLTLDRNRDSDTMYIHAYVHTYIPSDFSEF